MQLNKRKIFDMKNSPPKLLRPSSPSSSFKKNAIPSWEAELSAAVAEGIIAKGVFEWSSAARGNGIFTAEFDLLGEIPVRFESRPSHGYRGTVDVHIVISPRAPLNLNVRPGCVLPVFSDKGVRQGEATAFCRIYEGACVATSISFLYVSRSIRKRWQHVCGL